MSPPDAPPPPPPPDGEERCDVVPSYDVRNCLVCGRPMQGRKCKYVCPTCGIMTDCSDAY